MMKHEKLMNEIEAYRGEEVFSAKSCLKIGHKLALFNWKFILAGCLFFFIPTILAFFIVIGRFLFQFANETQANGWEFALFFIVAVLSFLIIFTGMVREADFSLKSLLSQEENRTQGDDIQKVDNLSYTGIIQFHWKKTLKYGVKLFFPITAFMILYILGMTFGFVLLIIPGIMAMVMWGFGGYFIITEKVSVISALKKSAALTKGHRRQLVWFFSYVVLISFIPDVLTQTVSILLGEDLDFLFVIYLCIAFLYVLITFYGVFLLHVAFITLKNLNIKRDTAS